MAREMPKMEPKYEIYVRLPFSRGDFVDPPPVRISVCLSVPSFMHPCRCHVHKRN
jgi:hypothetical protein